MPIFSGLGLARVGEPDLLALNGDRPAVVADAAGEHLHERRLAGPVVANEAEYLAAPEREVDAPQHVDRAVRLGDAAQFDKSVAGHDAAFR